MLQTVLHHRYQIIKKLGQGGFGTTYLAQDRLTEDSLCAVKQLNVEHADLEIAEKLFKREADILLQLQEVHQVPAFIDYFEESGCNYIVEEYIEGSSLDELISHHWNVSNIAIFLWDILSVLQILHSKSIVHRDIKPSNLIQRKKDRKFTIIDFGAVKEIDVNGDRYPETCIYHQGYAPPEQIQGIPRLNSDIHALGMTAIQLLTKTSPETIVRDASDRAILPESRLAPGWLVEILNKMVRTDFKQRYQSVDEVLKDLGQRNRLEPAEVTANSLGLSETHLSHHQTHTSFRQRNYLTKFWYVPLIGIPLLIIASEAIHPWLRTRYYLNRGNSLLDNNQAPAALRKFQQAIHLRRSFADAWKGRGNALFTIGRYSGALEAYRTHLRSN